ncbi:hypothetical protein FHW69_001612 [Luteibacter sp. Sphag1AF]|nr:hypothetical protein [Luteibacter sp. Sphag1AF]
MRPVAEGRRNNQERVVVPVINASYNLGRYAVNRQTDKADETVGGGQNHVWTYRRTTANAIPIHL